MISIVFATNNPGKIKEVSALLEEKVRVLSLSDIHCYEDIPETADTIEENASQKARYVYEKYHVTCFADDTGLEIEALGNKPGVYSARYAGEQKDPEANIDKVLNELQDAKNRKARFKTVISFIIDGKETQFEGIVNGVILTERRGEGGFGYDAVFMPDGYTQSFAEMSLEEKNRISHRAVSVQKLVGFLNKSV